MWLLLNYHIKATISANLALSKAQDNSIDKES